MSKRVLITGGFGFAGGYLTEHCQNSGDHVTVLKRPGEVVPEDLKQSLDLSEIEEVEVDLQDRGKTVSAVAAAKPDTVYHLAALASVARSWEAPTEVLSANLDMTVNLLDGLREHSSDARVVLVSSGEIYGVPQTLPITEESPLNPQNPYAVSKVTVDLLAGIYRAAHGLDVMRVRPFNHSGPRQITVYAIASFAKQIAAASLTAEPGSTLTIATGNPDVKRDFTDVRDVVRAYRHVATEGKSDVYNICSGKSVSIREIVELLGKTVDHPIDHQIDASRVRKHDVLDVRGSFDKLHNDTGWKPEIPLDQTLLDTVQWWRKELGQETVGNI